MSAVGLGNQVKVDSLITKNNSENPLLKSKNSIVEQIQTSFKHNVDNATFDPQNQKQISNNINLIVKLHDEYKTYSPSEKAKLDSVTGFKNNILNNLSSLKEGESEIKFRFPTDINKSTFESVSTEPKEYGKNKDFYYVNGINTKESEANHTAEQLSSATGQNFKPLYNKTDGVLSDLIEVSKQRFSDEKFDTVTLNTTLPFYKTLSQGKGLKIVAHSQGAAITAKALKLCEKILIYKSLNINLPSLSSKDMEEADKQIKKNKDSPEYKKALENVNKIMSEVEVITMGGAASQDQFPNVKLVEILNPKDPVPKVAGTNNLSTYINCKTESLGNVSFSKSNSNFLSNSPLKTNAIEHFIGGFKNIPSVAINFLSKGTDIIDFHTVDSGKYAYLNQNNVKSLLYNFGRQDFK